MTALDESVPRPVDTARPRLQTRNRLLRVTLALCLLLLAQYVLGLVVNLFVTIPTSHPAANSPDYFGALVPAVAWLISQGPVWAAVHASLGLALIVIAVVLAVASAFLHRPGYAATSIVGALAIIGAAFNGASFVIYNHDFSSMIMGGVWAIALACYLLGLFLLALSPE